MMVKPELRIEKFEQMAFGLFIHWGLYSLKEVGEWHMEIHGVPSEEYKKYADEFTAENYNPRNITKLAKKVGIKYIVLTTKHHEGFFLYDTNGLSIYDAPHSGAKRDLLKEFLEACREDGIVPILYHATLDWHEENYKVDFNAYLEYLRKSVEILCTNYGEIGGFWFDGNWDKRGTDWKLDELYGTIRKYQPNAMIINNTGLSRRGQLEHDEIDSVTFEQGLPTPIDRSNMTKYVSGEMCQTMNSHWGIARNDFNYKSTAQLIETLCACRKVGANYLLNIGPDKDCNITKMQEAMLEVIGQWMNINGKAIYEGKPCEIKSQGKDFALKTKEGKIYLFIHDLKIVGNKNVTLGGEGDNPRTFTNFYEKINGIRWIDNDEELEFTQNNEAGLLCMNATGYRYGSNLVVRVAEIY